MSIFGKPQFTHDCLSCKFLGQYKYVNDPNKRNEYDLYVCAQGGSTPTVIARFGNDGPDYMSGIHSNLVTSVDGESPSYPLTIALNKALWEGYLKISSTPKLRWKTIKKKKED